jgi:hypothetical protein
MGEMRNANKISVRKSEGNGPLRRSVHRWGENNKIYLRETGTSGELL